MADLGVHRVGEVDRGRPGGQADHLALRREDVDLLGADLEAEVVEELPGIGGLGLPVGDVGEPGEIGVVAPLSSPLLPPFDCLVLVLPVRRDAELGALVHLLGADLDLDRLALRPDDRRVQRLVEVELRRGDVVLEAAGDRRPARMDRAEHRVAVAHGARRAPGCRPGRRSRRSRGRARSSSGRSSSTASGRPADRALDLRRLEVVVDGVDDALHELLALRRALAARGSRSRRRASDAAPRTTGPRARA